MDPLQHIVKYINEEKTGAAIKIRIRQIFGNNVQLTDFLSQHQLFSSLIH